MRRNVMIGQIALAHGERIWLEVLNSEKGFYIGTRDQMLPFTRESVEYFATRSAAEQALRQGTWTQRQMAADKEAGALRTDARFRSRTAARI